MLLRSDKNSPKSNPESPIYRRPTLYIELTALHRLTFGTWRDRHDVSEPGKVLSRQ